MIGTRIYLGEVGGEALERIIDAVRGEYRSDDLEWYVVEQCATGRGDRWYEVEANDDNTSERTT